MVDSRTRWLDADEQRAWRALLIGTTLLFDRLDADLRAQFDLSLAEYEILVRLSEAEGAAMRMAALADALRHSRSRVTHTISRMEQSGLVARSPSGDDGRGVRAELTTRGMALLREAAPLHVTGVRENLVDLVPPGEFATMGRVMDAVTDRLIAGREELDIR